MTREDLDYDGMTDTRIVPLRPQYVPQSLVLTLSAGSRACKGKDRCDAALSQKHELRKA